MKDFYVDRYGNAAPKDAQYYDTFWRQFLKVDGDALYVRGYDRWFRSQHRDGVNMLNNGECVPLKLIDKGVLKVERTTKGGLNAD